MMIGRGLGILALMLVTSAVEAQGPPPGRGVGHRALGDSLRPPAGGQRAARQAIERVIRTQVRPTETQLRQLQGIDARFEPQRIQLNREEMGVRRQLRQLMLDTANTDQSRIGEALDLLVTFPGRRAALLEAEQKELGSVLTPLQRAKYQAIQEQVRRRIQQGRGGPPPGSPPPR